MAKMTEMEERIKKICEAINKGPHGGEAHDALTYLGSKEAVELERFSSGHAGIDEALGGGWPRGRHCEISGPKSSGKSTLVLHAIASFQKKYPTEPVALIDTEFSYDSGYAARIGVDPTYLIVHQPDNGEQALNILRDLVKSGVGCCVVDSVAALTTVAEMEGDIGDVRVAEQARMMSQAMRILTAEVAKRRTAVLWTNQIRDKIGVLWGEKTASPGGRALGFYTSIQASVAAIGKNKEKIGGEDVVVSSKNKFDVKKNKCSPPFRQCEFSISFGHGIDLIAAILDDAMEKDVVTKRGAWFSLGTEQLACGRAALLDMMHENSELTQRISDASARIKLEKKEKTIEEGLKEVAVNAPKHKKPSAVDEDEVVADGVSDV